jgi:hypothetical protein
MTVTNIPDVTLASVDPALLSCWEEKVKQGVECSLLLKHSKGKIFTILKTSVSRRPDAVASSPIPSLAEKIKKKKKKNKGNKQKRLESLLSFHQRLVDEEGMPPSKLMLEHAALASNLPSAPAQCSEPEKRSDMFNCDLCDYSNPTQRGVNAHKRHKHKEQQMPVAFSDEQQSKVSFNCDKCKCDLGNEDNLKIHMEEKHRCFKCDLCDHTAVSKLGFNQHKARMHSRFTAKGKYFENLQTECLCSFCDQSTVNPDDMIAHIYSEHSYIWRD